MFESEIPVLEPPEELTEKTLPLFRRVTTSYHQAGTPGLVLDLSRVRHVTSAGFGWLVYLGRRLAEHDAALAVAGGSRSVVRLLEMMGLEDLIPHFRTVEEATAWVRSKGAD